MPTIVDLHVHTTYGSGDSRVTPEQAVARARELGVHGMVLSEHDGTWDREAFRSFALSHPDLLLVRGFEAATEMGHLVVLGLERRLEPVVPFQETIDAAHQAGGFVILAHPFRDLHRPPPFNRPELFKNGFPIPKTVAEAAAHPAFRAVDTFEAANGGNKEADNLSALRVARYLGVSPVGASDAHAPEELATCVTVFEETLRTEVELLAALRVGRYYPAVLLPSGEFVRFEDTRPPPDDEGAL